MTSDSAFGELSGIRKAREIRTHTVTLLEQLAGIGDEVIGRYSKNVGVNNSGTHHEIYTAIETELADALPDYDAAGLQELVTAYSNKDDSKQEAITRGMYTGVLASMLTKRNKEKGERTHIHLTGDENSFPYLLYFAHTLDEVTIENFSGDNIARYAASYGGTANSIRLANITGYNAGSSIACKNGCVETVTLANITGNEAGAYIAHINGRVETVTLANITGNDAGANIAGNNGRVETVTLANITGDRAGANIAWNNDRVGIVTLANITGHEAGRYIASDKGRVEIVTLANITGDRAGTNIAANNGRVNALLAVNNKGEGHLFDSHATHTFTTLNGLANAQQIQTLLDKLAQPDRAPEYYAQASHRLGRLLRDIDKVRPLF